MSGRCTSGRLLGPAIRIALLRRARGAQCILLGCTEIGLLIAPADAEVPIFDTTILQAQRAVELALAPADS